MRIALLQMTSGIDPARNAKVMVDAISATAAGGGLMLFTPEMSGLIDGDRERVFASVASEERDVVLAAVRQEAAACGIWVNIGSHAVQLDGGKLANRCYVIDDMGSVRATYDKLHLFDVDLPTGESWRESNSYAAGEGATVVQTPVGKVGPAICYDLRFPELFQALSAAGAEILTMPAAFTRPTGAAHWHILQRARAIENACFVISAAQTGEHEDGRATYGHSLVIDPWGDVLLDMGEAPGLGFADIDLSRVIEVRQRVPVLAHRRVIPAVTSA